MTPDTIPVLKPKQFKEYQRLLRHRARFNQAILVLRYIAKIHPDTKACVKLLEGKILHEIATCEKNINFILPPLPGKEAAAK